MNIPSVTIKDLLEAGVHLGHKTLRWNPKMKKNHLRVQSCFDHEGRPTPISLIMGAHSHPNSISREHADTTNSFQLENCS